MREVLDNAKEVKVVRFIKAVKATKVIKTITGKVVCVGPFCYI